MNHSEYIRVAENSKTAVLMIHGILGTPRYFDGIVSEVPEGFSIYNILLDGHGGAVSDFAHTSMQKWKNQVENTVKQLEVQYENIVIMGHSMGTLLAIDTTLTYPDKIRELILFAVPLSLSLKVSAGMNAMKVIFDKINRNNAVELAAEAAYSVEHDIRLWKYIGWVPRYLELFELIGRVRNEIEEVKIPCRVFQSKKDEMVSLNSMKYLNKNPMFSNEVLENSGHYYYDPSDFSYMKDCVREILKTVEGE